MNRDRQITVVGLGAIGSYTSIALSKAAIDHNGFDSDIVKEKNIQNQAFTYNQIGEEKAYAIRLLSPYINAKSRMWTELVNVDIAIACADDMETRRKLAKLSNVMFDTRLAENQITLYASKTPANLLDTMNYENSDVPDRMDTCHTPSSTLEVVLTATGMMLKNIKHYLETDDLLWTYCGIDVENCSIIKMNN